MKIVASLSVVVSACLIGLEVSTSNAFDGPSPNWMHLETNSLFVLHEFDWGTNFLTIENRAWVQMPHVAIVRVTDEEWASITNHYQQYLTTNTITFHGK